MVGIGNQALRVSPSPGQATGIGEGLNISQIKRFQFLDNTCFYGRLRYTAAPYGFHIKLNSFAYFFLIQYPVVFDITCEVSHEP